MVTLAVELVAVRRDTPTVAGPTLGEVQGVGDAVGPHASKVTLPVGAPKVVFPVTVAVSTAELPKGTLGLLRAVVKEGVVLAAVTVAMGAADGTAAALTADMLATAKVVRTKMAAP
jgi:hypothetical protein